MTPLTDSETAEIQARLDAATQGDWSLWNHETQPHGWTISAHYESGQCSGDVATILVSDDISEAEALANGRLLVKAPTDIRRLLADRKADKATINKLTKQIIAFGLVGTSTEIIGKKALAELRRKANRLDEIMGELAVYPESPDAKQFIPPGVPQLRKEIARLQAIIDKLPKCWRLVDGKLAMDCVVAPGDIVYPIDHEKGHILGREVIAVRQKSLWLETDGRIGQLGESARHFASTRAAAEAAAQEGK